MASQPKNTTTPELEELRKGQVKKRSGADPAQVLDKAIYQLWETINDLDQITPDRVEHFRVSIFGSSRIRRGDPIYEEVKSLSSELARMGSDIVLRTPAPAKGRARATRDHSGWRFICRLRKLPIRSSTRCFAIARSFRACITSSACRRPSS